MPDPSDPHTNPHQPLAEDWVTIWRSELAGLAADREAAEHAHLILSACLAARAALTVHEPPPPGADVSPRPATAAPASVDGAALARIERRLAELERRLAAGVADP